ncbi:hypothetical protein EP7_004428 [Isosphaeraceae bacterium EP7]
MRLPAFRVRTLMLAVLAFAVIVGGPMEFSRLRRLSAYYRWCAEMCAANAQKSDQATRRVMRQLAAANLKPGEAERLRLDLEIFCSRTANEANRAAIFDHAASHPWEAVPERTAEAYGLRPDTPQVRRLLALPIDTSAPAPDPGPNFQWPGETMLTRDIPPNPPDPSAAPRTTAAPSP